MKRIYVLNILKKNGGKKDKPFTESDYLFRFCGSIMCHDGFYNFNEFMTSSYTEISVVGFLQLCETKFNKMRVDNEL